MSFSRGTLSWKLFSHNILRHNWACIKVCNNHCCQSWNRCKRIFLLFHAEAIFLLVVLIFLDAQIFVHLQYFLSYYTFLLYNELLISFCLQEEQCLYMIYLLCVTIISHSSLLVSDVLPLIILNYKLRLTFGFVCSQILLEIHWRSFVYI